MAIFAKSLRSTRVLTPWMLGIVATLTSCSQRESVADPSDPSTEPSTPVVGEDDKDDDPDVVDVDVDEEGITLRIDGLSNPSQYMASIVKVDGSRTFSRQNVGPTGNGEATATLELPDDLDTQAELVEWNVRIERKTGATSPLLVKSLLYFIEPAEVYLEGPGKVTRGKKVAYRVSARHAITRERIANKAVTLKVERDGETVETATGKTDETGTAVVELSLDVVGQYAISATSETQTVPATVSEEVSVEGASNKLLLTTDKPLYKPGQTIHLRTLALSRGDNTPLEGEAATFEVKDAKGNKVFKKTIDTDSFGIASTPFVIGRFVNEGTYTLSVAVAGVTTEKTVEVSQYALPKFNLQTRTEKAWYSPGEDIRGVVDARYFFGKSVGGAQVKVEAATIDVGRNVYREITGTTDADGLFEFEVETPRTLAGLPLEQGLALVNLTVTVTDTAGQVVTKDSLVRVAQSPLNISLVPEGTELITGIENRLNLFVTDPLGAPRAGALATLTPEGQAPIEVETDEYGHALVAYTPASAQQRVHVDATSGEVTVTDVTFEFAQQTGVEHVLVRTDKSIYDVGDTVNVEVLTSDEQGDVFIDWLNAGQAVDLRALEPEDGSAKFSLTLDQTLLGDNRIEAYIVQDDGNIVRAGRTIVVRDARALSIDITSDRDVYEPGTPASLSFAVTDENGAPAVAALGVQIVDEAVFSLIDAKPGLLQTYFQLEDEFAKPTYELHPPIGSLSEVILDRPTEESAQVAAQQRAEATLAALGRGPVTGLGLGSWPGVVAASDQLLSTYYRQEEQRLTGILNDSVDRVVSAVTAKGCKITEYWCDAAQASIGDLLRREFADQVVAYDFWGNAYTNELGGYGDILQLVTAGPDEVAGNADDETLKVAWDDVDWGRSQVIRDDPSFADAGAVFEEETDDAVEQGGEPGEPPGTGGGEGGGETDGNNGGGDAPRVRRDFPETLYFNPALITDPSGRATIELDLADSITQWRISSLGNTANGQLGSAMGALTVFQDFFVDVNFPAALTRGDEVTFPIAVYNYLDEPQEVSLALEEASWYTALAGTTVTLTLEPGEVRGVSFPVRVEQVGLNTLTVTALGTDKSDAVARSVRVVPDGKPLALAESGALEGSVTIPVRFEEGRIAGSEQLYVDVFPTYLSQAVQGLDSILQVPSGCFEQTTSTAWPNVLVTNYLKATGQTTPELLLKAESLMSAGYQRLLTFEHPGGGFSWFGTQDPAPFLSVTAFGLMEFHDMAQVHTVDEAMLQRTLDYLLGQQKSDGSWEGDTSEFFSFQTSTLRNTAFTLMAVGSAHYEGPETSKAVQYVKDNVNGVEDAYTLALAANALALVAPTDPVLDTLLENLSDMAVADPNDDTLLSWDTNGTQTNFYGYGDDADVTTTAMVVHAMLLAGGYSDQVTRGLNKLAASKDVLGNFGSTQATVWALKTLLLAATKGTEAALGQFVVAVDGDVVQTLELTAEQSDVMRTVDLSQLATTGDHDVTLTFTGEGKASYSLVSAYNIPWLEAPDEPVGPLSVVISYDRTSLAVDETVSATVTVANNTAQTQNMALVTVGLPPGFEVLKEDFDQYLDSRAISKVETTGRQVILYVSELAANQQLALTYRLRATMPVTASDGGGSVHPYYQPDQKMAAPEQILQVAANAE